MIDSVPEIRGVGFSEELDCIPLSLRWKMLHSIEYPKEDEHLNAETLRSCIAGSINESQLIPTAYSSSTVLYVENSEPPNQQALDSVPDFLSSDNSSSGHSVDCFGESILDRNFESSSIWSHRMPTSAAGVDSEQLYSPVDAFQENILDVPSDVLQGHQMGSSSANVQVTPVKHEMLYQFDDALDKLVLKERQKLLLSRKFVQSLRPNLGEQGNGTLSSISKLILQRVDSESVQDTENDESRNLKVNGFGSMASENATDGASHAAIKCSPPTSLPVAVSFMPQSFPLSAECTRAMVDASALASSVLPPLAKVKDEPLDTKNFKNSFSDVNRCDILPSGNSTDGNSHAAFKCPVSAAVSLMPKSYNLIAEDKSFGTCAMVDTSHASSDLLPIAKVKDEPVDINELCFDVIKQNTFIGHAPALKNEPRFSEAIVDELDHMPLVDRGRLLSLKVPSLAESGNSEFFKEDVASASDLDTAVLESVRPVSICRPRKKRRTATNSIETALEEDAPGILMVLHERGVSSGEIKLYGEEHSDDALDSLSEDDFAELDAVISQLFSQRETFLKFPLIRTKGAKISYCLSCLLALVEQTIYLRNRKWPVEWGWCRDLHSFIFVFQRHNRIVLERPEYGYATYFFELLNYVPVAWQIKRLVTVMKLTGCGRITVIENKPLVVGEDLSEGEAQVLSKYGWTPNTGLGTMLHYCDRVVHDRKQELDSSEWRIKIGKQLMNGYNGGNIVCENPQNSLTEHQDSKNVQVKLEEWTV